MTFTQHQINILTGTIQCHVVYSQYCIQPASLAGSVLFHFIFKIFFVCSFIFGCCGCSAVLVAAQLFSSCSQLRLLSGCSVRASRRSACSCGRAQAPYRLSWLQREGLSLQRLLLWQSSGSLVVVHGLSWLRREGLSLQCLLLWQSQAP